MRPGLVFFALALLHAPTTRALYEDQAGKVDWYRQQIGAAKLALFHAAGQQRLALVATEPGVIAGIDLRNGNVAWRQVLPKGESVTALRPYGKGLLSLSVSPRGAFVRLWGMMGGLIWDAHVPATRALESDTPSPSLAISGSSVAVAWQSTIRALHGGTGELAWETSHDGTQLVALVPPPAGGGGSTVAAAHRQRCAKLDSANDLRHPGA